MAPLCFGSRKLGFDFADGSFGLLSIVSLQLVYELWCFNAATRINNFRYARIEKPALKDIAALLVLITMC